MKYFRRKIPIMIATVLVVAFGLISMLTGCSSQTTSVSEDKLSIVATTTMLADLAKCLGGDAVEVTGLMGPGIDPHLYQASAGDVTTMQNADVVLYGGLHLEGKMGDVFSALEGQDKTVICVGNGLDTNNLLQIEGSDEGYDPHIWFDVSLWMSAANYVSECLSNADPDNSALYSERLESYIPKLEELDEYIVSRVSEIDEDSRVLITAHDAFKYFGKAYGFEVKGLQGISTGAEAGTADVSNLAQVIADNHIKAIFSESSVPIKTIESLQAAAAAKGFEVSIGGQLYSDSLGDAASGDDTYILTFKANINTIVDALK